MSEEVFVQATDDLREVIRSVAPGTKLVLMPGTYSGNLVIDKPLEITGGGLYGGVMLTAEEEPCIQVKAPQTLIWGVGLAAVSDSVTLFDIQAEDVAVDECTLVGGKTTVRVGNSNITLNHCRIAGGIVGSHLDQCGRVNVVDCSIWENRQTGVLCTNLERETRLVGCETHENGVGLATSYSPYYATLYGPDLYACSVHHNKSHGARITDEAWDTGFINSRIFENTEAQVFLGAAGHLAECDVSGGQVGVASVGGKPGSIFGCHIHDMPIGLWMGGTFSGASRFARSFSAMNSHIYNTTDAASRTAEGGSCDFLSCVIRDNAGAGVDIGPESAQELNKCRIVRNTVGMHVQANGKGDVTESVISQNRTGVFARSESDVNVSGCHIQGHSGAAVILEKDTRGWVTNCTYESNSPDIWRDPLSEVRIYGNPDKDHLAKLNAMLPPE